MFRRKNATQTKSLLEYLASAQKEQQLKNEHVIAQTAAVGVKNAELAKAIHDLENLLRGALDQDAYIDLDGLQMTPRLAAFNKAKPERRSYLPERPSRFALLMPWKKKAYNWQYESAEASYRKDRDDYYEALNDHQNQIDQEREEVDEHNHKIERYKQDFAAGKPKAIEEYFALVLEKSAYPSGFPKSAKIAYATESERLRIAFKLPAIDVMPAVKSWTYDKIRDEITPIAIARKRRRLLYASVLAQLSLRTVHEVFTADRSNKIDSIAFDGYVDAINPSSGQPGQFSLVALTITRPQFDRLDLSQVEPRACLIGLNGRLSSKPDQLLAVPPMSQEDIQDTTVAGEREILYFKQQISELAGTIQTQSAQITELESELAKRSDKNGELASSLQQKETVIAELERRLEEQRDRLAELAPNLRDEQERNAELNAEVQKQKDYIAELESGLAAQKDASAEPIDLPTEAPDDTQPIESIAEITSDSDFAAAGIFAPIASETPEAGAGGLRIPPREAEQQANMRIAPHPRFLETMSIIIQACQHGQFVDYSQAAVSEYHVNRLVQEGMLARSALDSDKLRPTQAGEAWYHKHNQRQQLPERDMKPGSAEEAYDAKRTVTLRSLLLGEADEEDAEATAPDEPASGLADTDGRSHRVHSTLIPPRQLEQESADKLSVPDGLVTIAANLEGDEAKLLALMMSHNWECSETRIQSAFPGQFISAIILNINERVYEMIDEHLIEEEDGLLVVDDEYRDALEQALTLTNNQILDNESNRR